jgi:hypothetical protein
MTAQLCCDFRDHLKGEKNYCSGRAGYQTKRGNMSCIKFDLQSEKFKSITKESPISCNTVEMKCAFKIERKAGLCMQRYEFHRIVCMI